MSINQKDLGAGLSFLLVSIVYGWTALRDLSLGVMLNMGPGYFPMMLCALLGLIGLFLSIRSLLTGRRVELAGRLAWRPVLAVSLAIILFGTFIREMGLLLSVCSTALICSFASKQIKWRNALVVSAILAVVCTGVFAYGVRLPLPVIGTWFRG